MEKYRGHPDLNQGPLDLQSNALPLSYIPPVENILKQVWFIWSIANYATGIYL